MNTNILLLTLTQYCPSEEHIEEKLKEFDIFLD